MRTREISNELRLVAACSWAPAAEAQRAQVEAALREPVDWEVFLALARRHEVAALACLALERWGAVPEAAGEALRQMATRARWNALTAAAECARVAREFSERGIDVMALKGGPLSVDLYGDPAARQGNDVDLLVRREEVERAGAALEELGYAPEFPSERATPRMRRMLRRCATEAGYRHGASGVTLDLHWGLELWTPEQMGELWRRSEASECLGAPMRWPAEDMLLLYLCDHGAKHNWSRMKWLGDVAMLLARGRRRPWEELFELARRMDCAVALASAVVLTERLHGLAPAEELLRFAGRERGAGALADEAMVALCLTREELRTAERERQVVERLRHQMLRRPGTPWREHWRGSLLQAEDLARFALPDALLWLHYPLRPFFRMWRLWRPDGGPVSCGRSVP